MKFFVLPWTQGSKSAKLLAEELEGKRILREGSSYKYSKEHIVINWGDGYCRIKEALNSSIEAIIDKSLFFARLKGTGLIPEFTTTLEGAKKLGYPVFCRTVTEGCDGKGIVIADCAGQLVPARLYVKGINKDKEFRVHIARQRDGTIEILGGSPKEKRPIEPDMENVPTDSRIWSGDTTSFGNFVSQDGLPMEVQSVVTQAFLKFPEVTFAAFDVVYDSTTARAFVIEANSAPLMTPQTVKAYGRFFREYARQEELANLPKEPTEPALPVAAPSAAAPTLSSQGRSREEIVRALSDNIAELINTIIPVQG